MEKGFLINPCFIEQMVFMCHLIITQCNHQHVKSIYKQAGIVNGNFGDTGNTGSHWYRHAAHHIQFHYLGRLEPAALGCCLHYLS